MDDNFAIDETSMDMDVDKDAELNGSCRFPRRHSAKSRKLCAKEERNASLKRVSLILQKSEDERTLEEAQMLQQCTEEVEEVQSRWKKRDEAKRRLEEFEEPMETLQEKCQVLAQAIAQSQHLVVYTGAGISTAARIPDYRGSNGIWTRLQQGKDIGNHDLSLAEPTYTHMALSQLYHQNILKYVVSQNCDGLHLRSGLPRHALSELHGNMYVEVCKSCKPAKEYWRLFDVTENTARYSHKTMRKCYLCNQPLVDTIVHFGERGTLQWPLNWSGASKHAQKATTILCLGSSLKVLKRYPWLWQMDKPAKKRPNLYIINLQWTPKDDCANVKMHGKCDVVMKIVMNFLGITVKPYGRIKDPIFYHATQLCTEELHTTTQPTLKCDDMDCFDKEVVPISSKNDDDDVKHTVKTEQHSPQIQSDLQDCDNTSNTRDNFKSDKAFGSNNSRCVNQISVLNTNTSDKSINNQKCSFSIDSILQSDSRWPNENIKVEEIKQENNCARDLGLNSHFLNNGLLLPQNYHAAFLAYYRFREALLLQNPILSYQDMLYYPYQTSFLYSGFHSIINPLPHLNPSNLKVTESDAKIIDNKITKTEEIADKINVEIAACKFCRQEYESLSCLFYSKSDSIFVKYKRESDMISKKPIVCLCCDYSTDEDDDMESKRDNILDDSESNDIAKCLDKDDAEVDKEQKEVKIQAGWFGKGYRKIKKPRKK